MLKACQRLAPKLRAISTSEGEISRTPARASSTMIQMAKSTTVRMMVVSPRPNITMITGTSADKRRRKEQIDPRQQSAIGDLGPAHQHAQRNADEDRDEIADDEGLAR